MCEPTESAKHSPQPDALHHITTHINTIIYSVRCCFAIEHPWPKDWRRDGRAERRNSSTKGKVVHGECSVRFRPDCPGHSRDRRPEGKRVCAGTAWRISGTACPRPHGGAESRHRALPAPRPTSPGSCCPRVPFTAGARAFRFTLPAPRPVFRRGLSTQGIPPGGRAGSSI